MGIYTQSDHDRATKIGGRMIVAAALIALLALILAVIS